MINCDFEYYKVHTLQEAYDLYKNISDKGLKAFYYAGGTEIVSSMRKGSLKADAIIDIKDIEGIQTLDVSKGILGSCASLNNVSKSFKNLENVLDTIGDHTVRNAITLGGNICGKLPYKEAILPLLGLDAKVTVFEGQLVEYKISELFDKRLKLKPGSILYQIILENEYDIVSKRLSESIDVDYPLIHLVVSKMQDKYFVGVSGYCSCPIFEYFDDPNKEAIVDYFMPHAKDNIKGSATYKQALFKNILDDLFEQMEVLHD
jgi:CO/xanthine dehydrogenase FAD-binding subunit